ncbi:MAG: dipeptidase PepE [Gemmatimonadaceae bacterium]|nr:dipeptidase PepE [Gemmatimonadaceae bacterium]
MELLLLSNSRNTGAPYLAHALDAIAEIVGERRRIFFVPFAGVTVSWDDYANNVRSALEPLRLDIRSAHEGAVLEECEVVMVGGGNTFHLLKECRDAGLLPRIQRQVRAGAPYIGWSAGSNLACPTIRTTNDMPIVDPRGFDALGFLDFQVNPHFTNELPAGHQGETRAQRLAEFLVANSAVHVLGVPEGDWLRVRGSDVQLAGPRPAHWFRAGQEVVTLSAGLLPAPLGVRA